MKKYILGGKYELKWNSSSNWSNAICER
jgi:hypothetical protein